MTVPPPGSRTPPDADSPPQPADPMLGRVLGGRFVIQSVLAQGGSGRIYRALQQPIGRMVAVKVLRPDMDPDERVGFEERFLREASLAGALQHPNVVTIHDFGREADGTCYLVMELLKGRNLKAALCEAPMDPIRVIDLAEQIARGLRHAHRAGLVHRDVKPGNIVLAVGDDGRERVKILDFGLVKGTEDSGVTRDGTFLGTPHYVSPEQARGEGADARSDLYSLGVIMYRALTGVLPFHHENAMSIALAHIREPYPPMAERAPDVPVPLALEEVVRRCMRKRPEERYPSADALLAELAEVRARLSGVLPPIEEPTTLDRTVPAADRSPGGRVRPLLPWSIVGGALALVAGVWWVGRSAPQAPEGSAAAVVSEDATPGASVREVRLRVDSEPPGAKVFLDGTPMGATPLSRRVTVRADDPHPIRSLRLHLDGYRDVRIDVDLSGPEKDEYFVLAPEPAEPRPSASEQVASTGRTDAPSVSPALASAGATRSPPAEEVPAASTRSASASAPRTHAVRRAANPAAEPAAVVADGVRFTAGEAAAALQWVNTASEADLWAAHIAPKQVHIILKNRPWSDLSAFAATYGIGPGTTRAVRAAALGRSGRHSGSGL